MGFSLSRLGEFPSRFWGEEGGDIPVSIDNGGERDLEFAPRRDLFANLGDVGEPVGPSFLFCCCVGGVSGTIDVWVGDRKTSEECEPGRSHCVITDLNISEKDWSGPQDITVWVSMLLLGTGLEVISENKGVCK